MRSEHRLEETLGIVRRLADDERPLVLDGVAADLGAVT
jgi:signal transduction histidine kinase